MSEAYIVDALRSPTGKRRGSLASVHPVDLGAHALKALVGRNSIPADDYDDVIFGCLDQVGPQAGDIARTSWLTAGLPQTVPGVTIDRQCGSSQQAVHFAAQAVMSGTMDVVVAGGVQHMTRIPIGTSGKGCPDSGYANALTDAVGWSARYGAIAPSQFDGAEKIAQKWNLSREAMEAFALESHRRAIHAIDQGYFSREIVPLAGLDHDETVRRETTLEQMASLKPLQENGRITAAISSQTCDASSAMLIVSETALKRYNLTPRARIHHMSVLGDDPIWMLTAPIPATERALKKAGMRWQDIDLVEINEAFASVVMAWLHESGYPYTQTNVNGGAIALGHPLGASGVKLMTTLLHELERRQLRYGLQTMCEGGGQANVAIIERL